MKDRERLAWGLAGALVAWVLLAPAEGYADRVRSRMVVASEDGRQTATLLPDGLVIAVDGVPRLKLEAGPDWEYLTTYDADGGVRWTAGSDQGGTMMKMFSADEKLRVEVNEQLIDSGAGVRLYDRGGAPRATFFADKRGGESGVELTDANRQPRIDIFAQPDGVSVIRASTSGADASAELSILPESDAVSRYTGGVPEPTDNEPYVPMLYMLDRQGMNTLVTPLSPR